MKRVVAVAAAILVLGSQRAGATVYSWRSADGALYFSNDAGEVPAEQAASASRFTSRRAAQATEPADVPEEGGDAIDDGDGSAEPPPRRTAGQLERAYERGFDAGLHAGRQEVLEAAELARVLATGLLERREVHEAPAAPIAIERPPGVSVSIVRAPGFRWSSHGCCGTSWPVWYPFLYGPAFLGGRFGHHRHPGRGAFLAGGRGAIGAGFRFGGRSRDGR